MKQKFSITVADVPMNIVCEESRETVDAAVAALNAQIGALTTPFSPFSTAGSLLVGLAPEEDKTFLFRTQFVLALIFLVAGFVLVGLGYCNLFAL